MTTEQAALAVKYDMLRYHNVPAPCIEIATLRAQNKRMREALINAAKYIHEISVGDINHADRT